MRPLGKVKLKWTPDLAYAIGLIVTDGSLSKDGRHIAFVSNDAEQLETFMQCLGIRVKIGLKPSGFTKNKCTHIQFGDTLFYKFLLQIGLMPNKSKIIGAVAIPDRFFFDFLRGHLDGDGSFYSYFDPRWKNSYMFYLSFLSASKKHIDWLRQTITRLASIHGHVTKAKNDAVYQLKFAKKETLILLKKIYYSDTIPALTRKKEKIFKAIAKNAQVLKLVNRPA